MQPRRGDLLGLKDHGHRARRFSTVTGEQGRFRYDLGETLCHATSPTCRAEPARWA